ncbi:HD-GYP domain-containing protein [Cytobacillus spongiae]|jgi:putative nucleotidyltransferase with HDIG domain|uniref:HD-GYP domain-containing protein n=1 Tax=Cytobacillus spongiae TaxID=2901381 RepID=UPI001F33BDAF|nr:HD-GYP domain-containing protein [Cytobacillus spongiae]UII55429.1 HD-GYP domain-containing protein [Cytobacillus spongiae]
MRLVATGSVQQGEILAKAIYNEKGQVLVNEGVILKDTVLTRLISLGISYIYIQDGQTEDISYQHPISEKLRQEAIQTIETTFQQVQSAKALSHSFVIEKAAKRLTELIKAILSEIRGNEDLLTLLSDVYTYDNYIFTHSLNVTMYTLAIGMELNLKPKDLERLGLGAVLHDVGKMKIPEEILLKPGRLTEEEFTVVKTHAEEGFEILRKVQTLPLIIAHCAYQHHERLNGTGYPRGLKCNEIHEYGKIIAVADVFDAVTSNRVYRQAMLPHEGLEILYSGVGTLFEPKVVEAFRRAVAIYPIGITVKLSDGKKGVVSRQNIGLSDRPVVRIIEIGDEPVKPFEFDLKSELSVVITDCDTTFKNE